MQEIPEADAMSGTNITITMTGAIKKTKTLKTIPAATKYQLTVWGKETVKYLKVMVGGRGIIKRQSGHLARNIGMTTRGQAESCTLTVGTGKTIFKNEVKYASVLDKGATIHAKKRTYFYRKGKRYQFKNGPYLYVPIYRGGMRHIGDPVSFRLVKSVRIHPFGWFTKSIKKRRPDLDQKMSKPQVLKVAERMAK